MSTDLMRALHRDLECYQLLRSQLKCTNVTGLQIRCVRSFPRESLWSRLNPVLRLQEDLTIRISSNQQLLAKINKIVPTEDTVRVYFVETKLPLIVILAINN